MLKKHRQYNAQNREVRLRYYREHRDAAIEYSSKYYQRNKKQVSEKAKGYRSRNKEFLSGLSRAYYQANRERIMKQVREYAKRNPAAVKEWRKEYVRRNQALVRAWRASRRALLKGAAGAQYTKESHIAARWDMWGGKCWRCGAPAVATDHVIPLSPRQGQSKGTHWPANLRPICSECNSKKNNKPWRSLVFPLASRIRSP